MKRTFIYGITLLCICCCLFIQSGVVAHAGCSDGSAHTDQTHQAFIDSLPPEMKQ